MELFEERTMSTSSVSGESYHGGPTGFDRETIKSAVLARNWWAVGLRGVAAIVFGLIALFFPGVTILSLALVFAAYAIVEGAATIVAAVRAVRQGEAWALLALGGLAKIAAGLFAALWPGITALAFVLVFGFGEIIEGAFSFGSAFQLREDHGRWWLALSGILAVVFGLFLVFTPLIGAVVLAWWLGIYAIALGIVELLLSFRLHSKHAERPSSAAPQGA
jgi:uncharacterized membrane protein HdeD (DUF308 family)